MTADTGPPSEPRPGEQAIAHGIAKAPGPIIESDDDFDGRGDSNSQAVARAHVYRLLTGRSFFELEQHLNRYPSIRRRWAGQSIRIDE